MRVLIMSDMEGVSGIVVWEQVNGGDKMYEEGRRLYTEEINAAVRGAKRAGATEIVAVDCHGAGGPWTFNSYVPELLDPDVEWVAHHTWSRYTQMFSTGCDACLLVGAHARSNTLDGVLCHTISTTTWRSLWFNDDLVGESGINAALCGTFGVPCVLVTGDSAVCREVQEIVPNIHTVAVKQGLTRFSARQIAPQKARAMIEEGTYQALTNMGGIQPYTLTSPVTITIDLSGADTAAPFFNRPGVEVDVPNLKVYSRATSWMDAWDQIWPRDSPFAH
jgi:D-amino peptidase